MPTIIDCSSETRMHTTKLIDEKIKTLETTISALKTIRDKIDYKKLTPEEESALWNFILTMDRK